MQPLRTAAQTLILIGRSSTWAKSYMDFSLQPWIPSGGCSQAPLQGPRDPPLPSGLSITLCGPVSECPSPPVLGLRISSGTVFPSEIGGNRMVSPEHSGVSLFPFPSSCTSLLPVPHPHPTSVHLLCHIHTWPLQGFFSQCPKTLPGVGAELPPDSLKTEPSMFQQS